jgi:carbon monoxide dehydrogenase subunit G
VSTLRRSAVVAAPAEAAWRVLADFGALSAWVPLVQHSSLLTDQTDGIGAVRRVQIARQTLVERVTVWDEPTTLAYTIEGLPPIVGVATNRWSLRPAGEVTEVSVTTEVPTGRNPVKRAVAGKVFERMALVSDAMLAGLAIAAASAATEAEAEEAR